VSIKKGGVLSPPFKNSHPLKPPLSFILSPEGRGKGEGIS